MRKNQAINPRPHNLTGWAGYAGATIALASTVGPITGVNGFARATTTAAGAQPGINYSQAVSGKAGTPVTVSVYVRTSIASNARFTVFFQNSAGTGVGGIVTSPSASTPANQWVRLTATVTSTADFARVLIQFLADGAPSGTRLDAAAVMIGATGNYFDGDFAEAPPLSYWWEGLPYVSPSTEAQIVKVTPKPTTASVQVEVNVNPTLGPMEHFRLTSADIYGPSGKNDYTDWTGWDNVYRSGTQVQFHTAAATGAVQRAIGGLVVGRVYKVYLTATRSSTPTSMSIAGVTVNIPTGKGLWTTELTFTATGTTSTLTLTTANNFTPALSLIRVYLQPVGGATSAFALTRTDANGVNQVRLLEGQEISDGALITEDYEAALTGPITYSLVYANGQRASASTALDVEGTFLAPSVLPQFGISGLFITGYDAARETASTTHAVIGREEPVVRIGAVRSRRGTLTVWASDYAAMRSVLEVYRRGEVVLLRQAEHAGLDLYHVATGVREGAYDAEFKRWRLDIDFTEVRRPDGPLLGSAGWTWDDVAANFATWDDVTDFFATWNDLQIGDE